MEIKTFQKEELKVRIFDSRAALGKAAAKDIADCLVGLLAEKEIVRVIFAAAPSQNETLWALREDPRVDWSRIEAYHMDEYVGLSPDAPQGFGNFLKEAIFDKVPFRKVNLISATAEGEAEAERYGALLREHPIDVVCMGIGENGHIAFNDPWVADLNDPKTVKVVPLDEVCRMQQVHDGCFKSIDLVPKYALTLTVPTLAAAKYHFCMVPAATKAEPVERTVTWDVSEKCPATVLRTLPGSVMYCDADSAAKLL